MNLSIILVVCSIVFLSLSLGLQLYQNKLIHSMDIPIITEYIDCNTQELKEFDEII